MNKHPISRQENLVIQEVEGEVLVYDLISNKALCLNPTSAFIWQCCDGSRSVAQINEMLGQALNSTSHEDLVWLALEQLKKENLMANESELEDHFAGLSRRDVIKKVGLGTMIALPLIAQIVAPHSAMAQSCVGPTGLMFGMVCAADCQCLSNCCSAFCRASGLTPGSLCLVDCSCVSGNCQPNSMCA